MIAEFSRYVVVGLCAAAAQYGILIGLTEGFDFDPVHSSVLGFLVAAIVSYVLNYRFTFRSNRRHVEALPIFCLVVAVAFVLNAAAMILFTRALDVQYVLAQVITTGITLIWQYSANRLWTFRSTSPS